MWLNYLFTVILLVFSLGQLGRISLLNGQVNLYAYELLLFILLAILVTKYKLKPLAIYLRKAHWAGIFIFYLLISFLISIGEFNFQENLISLLYWLRLTFYFIYFLYFCFHLRSEKAFKPIVVKALKLSIAAILLFSFVQYLFYPDLRNLSYLGWDPHYFRMFGLFLDASVAGAVFGFFFLFILFQPKLFLNQKLRLIILGLFLIACVLTFSRSLYLAFIICLTYYFLSRKSVRKIIILLTIFGALLILAPKPWGESVNLTRSFSMISRVENYKEAIGLWLKKPIFGIGYNRIRYDRVVDEINHAGASFHSSFLIILVSGGIVGLILFMFSLIEAVKLNFWSKYFVIFLGLLSLADNIILHPFVLFLLPLVSLLSGR